MPFPISRSLWESLDSYARKSFLEGLPYRPDYRKSVCDENFRVRRMINLLTVDGRIGFVRSGMDCDCSQYYSERVIDSWDSVGAYRIWETQYLESLDGPDNFWFVRPEEIEPQYRSADLAMMAYEDGHPSHIIILPFEELR